MANIAITSHCNLNCSYCFTQEAYEAGADSNGLMPLNIYEKALDLVERSDIKQIRILGGEPTLHPDFIPYFELALKTGKPLRLFTNGFIPENVLEFISAVPDEKINIVLNITHLIEAQFEMHPALERTLNTLNQRIMPGLNIFNKNIQLHFLLDLIHNYALKKQVRLGLAQPCIGYRNQFLLPKHYFIIGQRIAHFAQETYRQSIKINLDCGFVPCMFNGEDLNELGLDTSLGNHCEPIPDILPDGSIIPCYPLYCMDRKKMDLALSINTIRNQFQTKIQEYGKAGIFKICSICEYKSSGLCSGGCMAQKILRLHTM